jgi:hypothetical protein
MRLLKSVYDVTRATTKPVFIGKLNTGLSPEDAKAAWRYLKDKRLVDTFNIDYTARINGAGVDAIENAQSHPDQPSTNFPSVSYNVVYNTMNVGTVSNSPVQQGGINSAQGQTATYEVQDLADLGRLVSAIAAHIDELRLDARQKQNAEAQLAKIKAQLIDAPDPIIVKQAGRTLRNVAEGAIGGLVATAVQPTVWTWVHETMNSLFG